MLWYGIAAYTEPVLNRYDFNEGVNYAKLMRSYETMGYQGTNFGKAINEINRMVSHSLISEIICDVKNVEKLASQ